MKKSFIDIWDLIKKSTIIFLSLICLLVSSIAIADSGGFEEYDVGIKYMVDKEYTVAIKYFKMSAQKGNIKAMKMLGSIYEKNTIVPQNKAESFKWYKKAVDTGSIEALVPLGYCYYYGRGTQENKELAFQLFKKAADNGIPEAYSFLGRQYLKGELVKKDGKEALKWYTKSYEANIKNNEKSEASWDAVEIGNMYFYGDVVPKDIAKAMQWYKISVDLDAILPEPSYYLGDFYFSRKEYKEAVRYFKISSQKVKGSFVPGIVAMGDMYFLGFGFEEKDYILASQYYQKAAEQYNPNHTDKKDISYAMFQLGRIYLTGGFGIEQNIDTAKIWFRKSASLGDNDAKDMLSLIDESQ